MVASDLTWLPPPPADFRARCRALAANESATGADIRRLANFALDESALRHLASAIATLVARGRVLDGLSPLRLGVASNSTIEPLVPALIASAARHGILLDVVVGDYGQTVGAAIERLVGIYVPSGRNAMVASHYENLGFTLVRRSPSGETTWERSTANDVEAAPMRVVRSGYEVGADERRRDLRRV